MMILVPQVRGFDVRGLVCSNEVVASDRKGNMIVTSSMFIVLLESTVLIL